MAPDPERDRELEGLRAERGRTERELRRVNRALLVLSGMLASASVRSVVEATISLARALQIGVVAEGVETQDQADALVAMGCDEIQGFLVGRPMGADEFEQWAAARGRRECDD